MNRSLLVLVLGAVVLGGCATAAEMTGTATQQDLMQLRADVTQLQLALQRAKTDAERQQTAVDTKLGEQTAQRQRQADDLARRMEALTSSVTALSTRVDDLASRLDMLARRAAAPPSTRAPAAPSAPAPPTAVRPAVPAPGSPAPAPRPATTAAIQPQDIYQAAYIDFSKGSYVLSVGGFKEFLRRYPEHDLADNAQYWIGEAHFSLSRGHANAGQADKAKEELERAVQEFRKVIANYPRGDKAPTALYKEALALVELKQPAVAQARLQYLIDNFPQAEEAPLARERLAALKGG
jgi:TolA-binding protein